MTCRLVRIALGPGPRAEDLVRAAAGAPGLVCLRGAWADGTAIVTSHPVRSVGPDGGPAVLDDLPDVVDGDPDALGGGWFGRVDYDGSVRVAFHDHLVRLVGGEWQFEALWSDERDDVLSERLAAWRSAMTAAAPDATWTFGTAEIPEPAGHLAAVERAVELIRAGELYQVNVCTRLRSSFAGSSAGLFADLAAELEPVRGAYLSTSDAAVVSASPELFLRVRGREVRTAPIKGTLPRHGADGNDARLRASAKDAAENVMIVDLMRNDLGRVCETGSVRVPNLLGVEAHPGVWHLVSAVTGRLRVDVGWADLVRATFPPGSVTGAPKVRALEAIAELESAPRRLYTGAIGFVSPCWGAEFSVAIRTFEIRDGVAELGVGGGITADSVPMLEWRECLHKAAPLLRAAGTRLGPAAVRHAADFAAAGPRPVVGTALLETVLVHDGEPLRLADHLARLDRSCRELHGIGIPDDLAVRARAAARETSGRAVLRLVAAPGGDLTVRTAALGHPRGPSRAALSVRPAGLWRHKWADRTLLTAAEAACAPAVPLFVGADGAVLETTRGNVFLVRPDGGLVTPPLRDDLLPGVTRRALLDLARDEGRPVELRAFGRDELIRTPAFWTSSLSGAVPVHAVGGVALPRADALVATFAARLLGSENLFR